MTGPVRLRSAATRVYAWVKEAILDGRLPGGTIVTEGEIADELDVSRTPVREALLRLEVEALVRLYPKKGALVVPVTAQEAHDVVEARALIEEWAAGRVWERRRELGPLLQPHLAAMRQARRDGDVRGFSESDRGFHEQVVAAAGNDILTRQYRLLRERQLCIARKVRQASAARMDRAIRAHQELADLLDHGTKAAFLAATRAHLQVARGHAAGLS